MVWQTPQDFHGCLDRFVAKLKDIGVRVGPHMSGLQLSVKPGDPEMKIDNALHRFASHLEKRPAMVLVVMPSGDTTIVYNRVKYVCDVKEGLLNVCVVDTKFARANDPYFANMGLKVNLKLEGCKHTLNSSDLGVVTDKADADRSGNPQSGTVVDRGVTEAANWEFFFLEAHSALQGTARPAHYYVIYNEVFRKERVKPPMTSAADALEQLSHSMCYLFGRATEAVSVCPPAYYADLVCERARCYLAHVYAPTTPPSSAAGASSESAVDVRLDERLVSVHDRVRDAMFCI